MAQKFIDYTTMPAREDGLYATNNQFQSTGPKGFIEVKVLKNEDLYVRVDLPGVPSKDLKISLDPERKILTFSGKALSDFDGEDSSVREYIGEAGLGCDCCKIKEVWAKMESGVVRMTVSRVKVKGQKTKCTNTLPLFTGRSGRCPEDNPFVKEGRKRAFVAEPTPEGGLNFAVDVPGVSADALTVFGCGNEVKFYAVANNVSEHDDGVRSYKGTIVSPYPAPSFSDPSEVSWDVEFGVLKVIIPPPAKAMTRN